MTNKLQNSEDETVPRKLNRILCEVIPHNEQRYDTCGDYYSYLDLEGPVEVLHVSKLPDERYEHLVLIHELVERVLCYHRGITNEAIDKFDLEWEAASSNNEPGNDPSAPYFHEHQFASHIEKLLAMELGVDWEQYEKAIDAL